VRRATTGDVNPAEGGREEGRDTNSSVSRSSADGSRECMDRAGPRLLCFLLSTCNLARLILMAFLPSMAERLHIPVFLALTYPTEPLSLLPLLLLAM
jgi:hypothetical protein